MNKVSSFKEGLNLNPRSVSIIFSFRNESSVLHELITRTRVVLRAEQSKGKLSSYELVFVNDDSTDNSLEILLKHAENNCDIRIVNMSRRFGVSPCVLAGMEYSSGDAVVYMDADLQDPPEVLPELLQACRDGDNIDVVHTVRKSRKGESPLKLFLTKIGYSVLNKVTSINLPIEAGDFKLLSRKAVNHILQLKENRPFMRGLVCWIGFKQAFISYHREPRYAGKTKFHILSPAVMSNFFGSALISFSSAPLMIASYFGLFMIFIDFLIMGHAFWEKVQGRAVPGWTAIMIVVLFLGSVQLLCLGIIGLYLNSVYEQTKNRPTYIVNNTFGFSDLGIKQK